MCRCYHKAPVASYGTPTSVSQFSAVCATWNFAFKNSTAAIRVHLGKSKKNWIYQDGGGFFLVHIQSMLRGTTEEC